MFRRITSGYKNRTLDPGVKPRDDGDRRKVNNRQISKTGLLPEQKQRSTERRTFLRVRHEYPVCGNPCGADLLGRYDDPGPAGLRLRGGRRLTVPCNEVRIRRGVWLAGIYRAICRLRRECRLRSLVVHGADKKGPGQYCTANDRRRHPVVSATAVATATVIITPGLAGQRKGDV